MSTPVTPVSTLPATPAMLDGPRERVFDYHRVSRDGGYEYVRVWEGSHLLDMIEIAFREAGALAGKADHATSEEACRVLIEDALRCTATGEHYARMLLDTLAGINPRCVREPAF